MHRAGLMALYAKKNTSLPNKFHKKYPYLLRGKRIRHPKQVWAADITYIKLKQGTVYLMVIIDLYSRKILGWVLSNSLSVSAFAQCLEETIRKYGTPAIFNTDQGSQFTSEEFTAILESEGIRISMDSKGRALDNIYVERVWRSLKYEDIYLKSYSTKTELKAGISEYINFYNSKRFHQSLDYETPDEKYQSFRTVSSDTAVASKFK